jgi:hypothetical protein
MPVAAVSVPTCTPLGRFPPVPPWRSADESRTLDDNTRRRLEPVGGRVRCRLCHVHVNPGANGQEGPEFSQLPWLSSARIDQPTGEEQA